MDCPVCGTANEIGAVYCYRCGSALRPGSTPAGPATGQTVDLNRDRRVPAAPLGQPSAPGSSSSWPVNPTTAEDAAGSTPMAGGARVYDAAPRRPVAPYVVGSAQSTPRTSSFAIMALILGIVAWIFLPFIAAIGAIITGHMGRREIRASQGQLSGAGMATAGLILGYINIALSLVAFCLVLFLVVLGASGR
jgi:hypothetical protein